MNDYALAGLALMGLQPPTNSSRRHYTAPPAPTAVKRRRKTVKASRRMNRSGKK